jgi:hypothetical protein
MKIIFFVVVLFLSALVWRTTYSQEKELSGTEKAAVLTFSEAATDNLLAGWAANDYARFSHDFDSYMKREMPATKFTAWKQDLDIKIGNYLSREVVQVTRSDEFYVVVYQAKFKKEEPVIIGVAFHAVEPHSIGHLWFDSEKLQQK